jgi:hypothetical protein
MVLAASCLPSLYPYYTDEDLVVDPRLVGRWTFLNDNESQQWTFEMASDGVYSLVAIDDDGKRGEFKAHLFKLRQELFLDIAPGACKFPDSQYELINMSMIPGHLLIRISQSETGPVLAFFDFEWLSDYLKSNPEALAYREEADVLFLTASTRDLQRFVKKQVHGGKLFGKPGTLLRRPSIAPSSTETGR